MTEPQTAQALTQLVIAAAILAAVAGWLSLARSQARERNTHTRRMIGEMRRDRDIRDLKLRARRWYRRQARYELLGLEGIADICRARGGALWRQANETERESGNGYALQRLPFTVRR